MAAQATGGLTDGARIISKRIQPTTENVGYPAPGIHLPRIGRNLPKGAELGANGATPVGRSRTRPDT
jgi:hypothetical protein